MDSHTRSYYEEIRNRDSAYVIKRISANSNMSQEDARMAYEHLFVNEHELPGGTRRFDPDYYIAQSTQRIVDTGSPLEHDMLLFPHEATEAEAMSRGMTQSEAHEYANARYNYQKALSEWLKGKEG